jgi:hypothetical protein
MGLEDRILDYMALRGNQDLEFMLDGDEESGYNLLYGKKFDRDRYFDSSAELLDFYNRKLKHNDHRRNPYLSFIGNANKPMKENLDILQETGISSDDVNEWVVDVHETASQLAEKVNYRGPVAYSVEFPDDSGRQDLEKVIDELEEADRKRMEESEKIITDGLSAAITEAVAGSLVGQEESGENIIYFNEIRKLREEP